MEEINKFEGVIFMLDSVIRVDVEERIKYIREQLKNSNPNIIEIKMEEFNKFKNLFCLLDYLKKLSDSNKLTTVLDMHNVAYNELETLHYRYNEIKIKHIKLKLDENEELNATVFKNVIIIEI